MMCSRKSAGEGLVHIYMMPQVQSPSPVAQSSLGHEGQLSDWQIPALSQSHHSCSQVTPWHIRSAQERIWSQPKNFGYHLSRKLHVLVACSKNAHADSLTQRDIVLETWAGWVRQVLPVVQGARSQLLPVLRELPGQ